MPLNPGDSLASTFDELGKGKTYKKTKKKSGVKKANKQRIAIALRLERDGKRQGRKR
jgi:hypothetical protein